MMLKGIYFIYFREHIGSAYIITFHNLLLLKSNSLKLALKVADILEFFGWVK